MAVDLNFTVHVVNVAMYSFTVYYSFAILNVPPLRKQFKEFDPGQMKYLTIWNLVSSVLLSIARE